MENEADNKEMHTAHESLVCPICGSKNISFTEEIRKSLCRLARAGLIVIYIIAIYFMLPSGTTFQELMDSLTKIFSTGFKVFTVFWLIAFIATCLIIWNTERKSHAKGICHDCGHLWLLD